MTGPTGVRTRPPAPPPLPQKAVQNFNREGEVAHFFSPRLGQVSAPARVIPTAQDAETLVAELLGRRLRKGYFYELKPGVVLQLADLGEGKRAPVFSVAADPTDTQAFILPETLPTSWLKREGLKLPLFLDPVTIRPEEPEQPSLVRGVEIKSPEVARFVEQLLATPRPKGTIFRLIYHNYRDEKTDAIKLRADALAMVHREKGIVYVLVHKLPGTRMRELPLEFILGRELPPYVVTSGEMVSLENKIYDKIYDRGEVPGKVLDDIQDDWPFPLPAATSFVFLKKPAISLKERINSFREALRERIFGSAVVGRLVHSTGKGLTEGALLFPIWSLAEVELKVAAILGFWAKFVYGTVLFIANNRAAAEAEELETREEAGAEEDKLYPLYEMGERRKTATNLIRRYTKNTLFYLATAVVYLQLFPPVFNALWAVKSSFWSAALFVAGFFSVEVLTAIADTYDHQSFLVLSEGRLRNNPKLPQFKKPFWRIRAFEENLNFLLYLGSILAGYGVYSLTATFFPAAFAAVGITIGSLALVMCCFRFALPLFGREEKTCLEIGSPDPTRYGKKLKFSQHVFLLLGDNEKVEVIEEEQKWRTRVPDFDQYGIKLRITDPKGVSITVRKSWLSRLLPFSFARKHFVIIKTKSKGNPPIIITTYGREPFTAEEVRAKFLEA